MVDVSLIIIFKHPTEEGESIGQNASICWMLLCENGLVTPRMRNWGANELSNSSIMIKGRNHVIGISQWSLWTHSEKGNRVVERNHCVNEACLSKVSTLFCHLAILWETCVVDTWHCVNSWREPRRWVRSHIYHQAPQWAMHSEVGKVAQRKDISGSQLKWCEASG